MTLSDLKIYFRTLIKVVAGGPPVGTPGSNRAAGMLAALDKLAEFASGQGTELLTSTYVVQPADVTNPASALTISVPGALAFGVVGIGQAGQSGFDPLKPTQDYTVSGNQLTIAASRNPPLAAGNEVHYAYLTGSVQAAGVTPAQLETVRTTVGLSTAVSTNYTLALSDAGSIVPVTAAVNITVPLHSMVSFPVGAVLELVATTPALFTVQAASGVTVLAATGNLAAGQGIPIRLVQLAIDSWLLTGGSV